MTKSAASVRDTLRGTEEVRAALDRMWPVLTPAQLLHDLFGSKALLSRPAVACSTTTRRCCSSARAPTRSPTCGGRRPTSRCSTTPATCSARSSARNGKVDEYDEIRTYGHIVIDEVQDLTPMQLKMATRRSLNGSMTIVGDIAQATGPLAPDGWDDVLAYLPDRKPARVIGLSRRLPHPAADHAARRPGHGARHAVAPAADGRSGSATPLPRSSPLRRPASGDHGGRRGAVDDRCVPDGSLGVVAPDQLIPELSGALTDAGITHGTATRTGLDAGVTLVPVSVVKGLELDGVVVVEPHADRDRSRAGHALAVRRPHPFHPRLTVVHSVPLPNRSADPPAAPENVRRGLSPADILGSSAVAGVVVDQAGEVAEGLVGIGGAVPFDRRRRHVHRGLEVLEQVGLRRFDLGLRGCPDRADRAPPWPCPRRRPRRSAS